MNAKKNELRAIPTNIITGFLGVGKTSAILHLLNNKPSAERWAVLVNEFGEIGVDGSLFAGHHSADEGVFVREVPGGCMCCAAGLPMQIALNQLLIRAKPDRLLIEPTGLGHPKEVLQVLSAEHYHEILALQRTLTLVDARKLTDQRYTSHNTFNQQVAVADVVIGNKSDLYEDGDKARLMAYVKEHAKPRVEIIFSQYGEIALSQLEGATSACFASSHHHFHANPGEERLPDGDTPIPESGFLKAINEGEGYSSIGWRFSPDKIFNRRKLYIFLSGINAERMKAVFITDAGIFGYNLSEATLTEIELDDCPESRIEIITAQLNIDWEKQLMTCIADGPCFFAE